MGKGTFWHEITSLDKDKCWEQKDNAMVPFLQRNQWRIYVITALLLISFVIGFIVLANVSHSASQPNVAHATSQASIFHPETLTVTVLLHRDVTQTTKVVYTRTLENTTAVSQLYQEIISSHIVKPDEIYNCPAALTTYYSYHIDFQQKGKAIIHASTDATGCSFWIVKDNSNATQTTYTESASNFWSDLHNYTGTPEPSQALHQ